MHELLGRSTRPSRPKWAYGEGLATRLPQLSSRPSAPSRGCGAIPYLPSSRTFRTSRWKRRKLADLMLESRGSARFGSFLASCKRAIVVPRPPGVQLEGPTSFLNPCSPFRRRLQDLSGQITRCLVRCFSESTFTSRIFGARAA